MIPEKEDIYSGILYKELMDRLHELCKGRVLVSADEGHKPEDLTKPDNLTQEEWDEFEKNLEIEDVFVELTIQA